MRTKRTQFHIEGHDTVIATRVALRGGWKFDAWTEVIIQGEPRKKPGPDIFGNDLWPDWPRVVKEAKKELAARSDEAAATR